MRQAKMRLIKKDKARKWEVKEKGTDYVNTLK